MSWSNLAAVYATREPPDLPRARKWYRKAAKAGDPRGLFEYGLMLVQGEGGPKRPADGRRLLERAGALGDVDALKVLVAAYEDGWLTFARSRAKASAAKRKLRRALRELQTTVAGRSWPAR